MNGFTISKSNTCATLSIKTSNGEDCPRKSFQDPQNTTRCNACSPECNSCTGPSSNDCTVCASPGAMFNNSCVSTNDLGICANSNGMIADNVKNKCEGEDLLFLYIYILFHQVVNSFVSLGCGAIEPNCLSCEIKNFNVASTVNQAECTGCLTGFFLSSGKCVKKCPSGTFGTDNVCQSMHFLLLSYLINRLTVVKN
jgi:hypothetical protein